MAKNSILNFLTKLKRLGPGAMVAAAFIGPGTVTTATLAGSNFGYTLLWAIAFSTLATIILQEMAARLGVVASMGVGEALRIKIRNPGVLWFISFLVISALFIGNAAYEAGNITGAVLGIDLEWPWLPFNPIILLVVLVAFVLLWRGKYQVIERFLVLLVGVMGVVFLVAAVALRPDITSILSGLFIPRMEAESLVMVVSLIGTTVVPYNLFLHASSVKRRWNSEDALNTSRIDTIISVLGGGIITMAILISSAVAFTGMGIKVESAGDLAIQLQPLLGSWALPFLALGFLAAGLSSSITAPLAAAHATSEVMGWNESLQGRRFRLIWLAVLIAGAVFSSLGFKPTMVILFAQFANGLLLPLIAALLVWLLNDHVVMGAHRNTRWANFWGIIVIIITIVLGIKSIWSVSNAW